MKIYILCDRDLRVIGCFSKVQRIMNFLTKFPNILGRVEGTKFQIPKATSKIAKIQVNGLTLGYIRREPLL